MLSNQERALRIELQDKLWELTKSNQSLLRRKLRDRWLMEGDNNTKYFHMMVNWRRKKNMLRGLRVGEAWVEEPVRVKEVVKNYFQENIS